ncbi:MAG: crotonase/enoyl-CoA hydratase family protein [Acidobacteriota bacterium]|nr:crotonase/enoyl-CoA hydratase family protein [Acidobacteriota bacterium]
MLGLDVRTLDRVTTLTISRPEVRNALDRSTSRELARAFRDFEADDSATVAVLAGSDGAFCAGADLKELAEGDLYEPWAWSLEGPTGRPCAKPVIAAVEGHACAGGLGLALWCDLRVAAQSAVFGVFSRRWGIPMSDGTTVRLPRVVGLGRALDMLLTGRPVGADEALGMGLVSRVVPTGGALGAAREMAQQIASHPQAALLCDRTSTYGQAGLSLAEALRAEAGGSTEARRRAASGAHRFARGEGRHGATPEEES